MAYKVVNVILSIGSSLFVLCCLHEFVYFLSLHSGSTRTTFEKDDAKVNKTGEPVGVVLPLIRNLSLLILFVVQHSMMSTPEVKTYLSRLGLQVAERSIFNLCTSIALILLTSYWQRMPETMIWSVNTTDCAWSWWTFTILHACAWYVVYSGTISMDFLELLGLKQVYYNVQGLAEPLLLKSTEQCRLYSHMRHPSFTAFSVLFWVHPFMSLDRLLLALVWTLYMVTAWTVDPLDHNYLCKMQTRKQNGIKSGHRTM